MKRVKKIKKQVLTFNAVFLEEDDGGYSVSVPSLQGCFSEGDNFEEAMKNVRPSVDEAAKEYFAKVEKDLRGGLTKPQKVWGPEHM